MTIPATLQPGAAARRNMCAALLGKRPLTTLRVESSLLKHPYTRFKRGMKHEMGDTSPPLHQTTGWETSMRDSWRQGIV